MVEVEVGGKVLDTFAGTGINVSLAIDDPRTLEDKRGAFAENINLPATAHNRLTLGALSIPFTNIPDGYLGFAMRNGGFQFVGKSQVTAGKNRINPESIALRVFGGNSDWAIEMESPLSEIAAADTIDWTWANMEAANNAFPSAMGTQPYCFPIIHYGDWGGSELKLQHLRPAIGVMWLLKQIFVEAGYTLGGQFINSTFFSRLIMPFGVGEWLNRDDEFVNYVAAKANGTQVISTPLGMPTVYSAPVLFQNESQDPDGCFATSVFTCSVTGNYDVLAKVQIIPDLFWSYQTELRILLNGSPAGSHPIPLVPNGQTIAYMEFGYANWSLAAGDTVSFEIINLGGNNNSYTVLETSTFDVKRRIEVLPNQTGIPLKSILWGDKSKIEFIRGVIRVFNLQVATSPITRIAVMEPSFDCKIGQYSFNGFYQKPSLGVESFDDNIDHLSDNDVTVNRPNENFFVLRYNSDGSDTLVKEKEQIVADKLNIFQNSATKVITPALGQSWYDLGQPADLGNRVKEIKNPFFAPTIHGIFSDIAKNSNDPLYLPIIWNGSGTSPTAEYRAEPRLLFMDIDQALLPKLEAAAPPTLFIFRKVYACDYAPQTNLNPLDMPNLNYSDEVCSVVLNPGLNRLYLNSIAQINNGLFLRGAFALKQAYLNNYLLWRKLVTLRNETFIVKNIEYNTAEYLTTCELLRYKLASEEDAANMHPRYIATATTDFVVSGFNG